jgi:hypothetical protein
MLVKPIIFVGLALLMSNVAAQDSDEPDKPTSSTKPALTDAEIAKEAHNPLGNLREVILQTDILPNVGPLKKTELVETIQTVFPISLGNDWKVMTYGIIPLVSQPALSPGDSRSYGLGDSTFFGYFVPPNEGKLIWGFGPALEVPTATGDIQGSDKWSIGPSVIIGVQPGNWSIFGLFDNVWDFAGSGDEEVNAFNLQYQAVYLLPKNWFFITNWNIEADWTEPSNNTWTVPVGGGFGRQFRIGKQVLQAYGQVGYNVVSPDGASTWRGIFVLDLIF